MSDSTNRSPSPEPIASASVKRQAATPEERLRRRTFWMMPSGLYVVGSRAGEKRNLMTLNWATQVSMQPVRLGIGVLNEAYTHELISESRRFTLCLIDRDDRALVRKFVKPTPWDPESSTLNGVPVSEAPSGVPVLKQALAYFDCEVWQEIDSGDHTFFIANVTSTASNCENREETAKVLRMEDTKMNYGG